MWQAQTFMSQDEETALAEMLTWLNENEEIIVEYQAIQVHQPDGTHVCVVAYRARRLEPQAFIT
ncbi:hypothetical protein Tter_0479 [Thermobaculum terrenum ATCC BAA-798]|uniref:Uncharacterized protein n=1 Tax=Thermobaculum terrenum (strain ATCC BAA-798 / CCMEE 7001 / YNP1) TaxID=525904 RepID=D1CEP4_THET1|nr:hypothetical protein [Thermobaculum terrenum]ACZ41400.1 hypothetical protein Tter_0479 [Thermobaculum terrenum ATCC BAA-798]